LAAHGVEFGSHTINHPLIRFCTNDVISREITESKKIIEDRIGSTVVSFSIPYQFPFEDRQKVRYLADCIRFAGYRYAVSTVIGIAKRPVTDIFLDRLPMNNDDDERLFIAKLEGAYNWVVLPQRLIRAIKKTLGIRPPGKRF
jgi:peptidoglycan/xylan/chitin deacetylase (PgdA/CDA1 family)